MSDLYSALKQTKPLPLEDEVYVNLLLTGEALHARVTELLKQFDITPQQYNVLRILKGAGKAGHMCREIAERMITRDPDITQLLDRLEARNLIVRSRDAKDRRVILACLTDEGRQLVNRIVPVVDADLKDMFKHMNRKELDTLKELLELARVARILT